MALIFLCLREQHTDDTISCHPMQDGKLFFFCDNGEPEYIREKELPYAEEAKMCTWYIIIVFFGNKGNNDHDMQVQGKEAVSCMKVTEAIENNSPNLVIPPIDQPIFQGRAARFASKESAASSPKGYHEIFSDIQGEIRREGLFSEHHRMGHRHWMLCGGTEQLPV